MSNNRKSNHVLRAGGASLVALALLGCAEEQANSHDRASKKPAANVGANESRQNPDDAAADDPQTALPAVSGGNKEWTYAIYLASETDDDMSATDNVDAMERLYPQLSPFMDIVVLADGFIDTERGWVSRSRLLQIRADESDHIVSEVEVPEASELAHLLKANDGELLMSSPTVLKAFLDLVNSYYPSRHLALDVFDHGGAWRGAVNDYDDLLNQLGPMTPAQFSDVFSSSTRPIDVLAFDACVMQNFAPNTWWQLSQKVKYVVASEQNQVAAGWTMANVVGHFSERHARDGKLEPDSLARGIVDAFNQSDEHNTTLSAIDLDHWPAVVNGLDQLGQALLEEGGVTNPTLRSIVDESVPRTYGDPISGGHVTEEDLVDVTTFCTLLESTFAVGTPINAAASALRRAVDEATIVNRSVDSVSHGVSLYLPMTSMPANKAISVYESYSDAVLALTPNWRAFLDSYPPSDGAN